MLTAEFHGPAVLGGYKEFQHGNRGEGTIKQDHRRMKYHCNLWNFLSLNFHLKYFLTHKVARNYPETAKVGLLIPPDPHDPSDPQAPPDPSIPLA